MARESPRAPIFLAVLGVGLGALLLSGHRRSAGVTVSASPRALRQRAIEAQEGAARAAERARLRVEEWRAARTPGEPG